MGRWLGTVGKLLHHRRPLGSVGTLFFATGTHEHNWEIFLATGTHWGHLGNVALEVLCLHVGGFWLKFGQNQDSLCKGRKIVPDMQFLHLLQHKGKVVIINPDIG